MTLYRSEAMLGRRKILGTGAAAVAVGVSANTMAAGKPIVVMTSYYG